MSEPTFAYDVFVAYSPKDKPIARGLAERLREDGVKVWFDEWKIKRGSNRSGKIEEGLENSHTLILCMSKNTMGLDWERLENYTFRFRDPLNNDRRFLPLLIDDTEINDSIAQFLYLRWKNEDRNVNYLRILEFCRVDFASVMPDRFIIGMNSKRMINISGVNMGTSSYDFLKNGKYALSGHNSGVVCLWDIETGKLLRILKGHEDSVFDIAWSPDGKYALSGEGQLNGSLGNGIVRLWDIETGKLLRILKGHEGGIWNVVWSPDGKYALSGGAADGVVCLWDIETGKCLRILEGHKGGGSQRRVESRW